MKYTELITNYHRKPLFVEHVDLISRPQSELSASLSGLLSALDIDSAAGAQLDILGEWIGRNRKITAPIEDYFFTLDSSTLGFGYGTWKNRYDPESGAINVDDEDYRTMLRAKIGANGWDGTTETLPKVLQSIYPKGDISLSFTDNQNMSITVYVNGNTVSNITKEIIKQGYLAVKPAGVSVIYKINEE
ncbi:DUF2612 domain-containing protein [Pantoea sp. MBD-2R]|uniref:DUF2612 domain-containing protein n=1 Tax=Pantoea sp. MBD-2R TaxID=3141540 RepID=UPI003182FC91